MDVSRVDPYVSCIKIRGVPIIAPLMTDDLRAEMKYYKQLAVAVERRLKNLEAAGEWTSPLSTVVPDDRTSVTEDTSTCDPESDSLERTDKPVTIVQDSSDRRGSVEITSGELDDDTSSRTIEMGGSAIPWKSMSDEEADGRNVVAASDVPSDPDVSENGHSAHSTMDVSSQKPVVPKSLNIVPITVDAPLSIEKAKSMEQMHLRSDESDLRPSPESSETPKLVRQGSYILETPSPMLLAHLQEEMRTYVPSKGSAKRREWNLSEAKSEWELHKKKENLISPNIGRSVESNRIRRNSASNSTSCRTNRRTMQSRQGKNLTGSQQVAKSADCIQSMLYTDNYFDSLGNSNLVGKSKGTSENCGTNMNDLTGNINSEDSLILNTGNKLGGSLGSLSNAGIKSGKRKGKTITRNRLSKSFDSGEDVPVTRNASVRGSPHKLLSTVTSDKLVDVFQQIQMTHDRQMKQLLARQCQEQQIMQKEFETQQNLLLSQIEQTFPGISLGRVIEKVDPVGQNPRTKRREEEPSKVIASSTGITGIPKLIRTNGFHIDENNESSKCPLDDFYPRGKCSIEQKSPPIGLYSTYVVNGERSNNGVSRQLFPLHGKTRHVPVPNRAIYQQRHINAATVITAYAKGYLVRRLLKTDRVIDLKTTYKEALHCMLKLHVDAPLALPELNFHQRLQLQCDAASMNIVELFGQHPAQRMEIIRHDREMKKARQERPNSARSYSFATQRTLARKRLKEMGDLETAGNWTSGSRSRCQTWASNAREKRSPCPLNQGIKRSTSAGAVRKPWR